MGGQDTGTASSLDPQERQRFEELTLPHLDSLYRLAVRLKGDSQDAEDLVQDTYLKALRAFSTLRQPERVRSWLFQILSRLVMDHHRSETREITMGDPKEPDWFSLYDQIWDEDPFPYSDCLHDDFLKQFEDEEVRRALLHLPEVYRLPLVLLYGEEMSYRDLAEVLGCPVGTVMSRLHRGRKILERELWECAKRRGLVRTWKT
ncbi:MAG: sigma-70 family RNA polymerase sigma factor [Candidatus Tectomicrobia bacterium]|uniref:RNA polymerase sigma factor n=1 Tax=Tectimicrobiota bacterium TaxID=2528274 RepID=A0A932GT07_UNCTE|nr:sigma-70 family RNA polymerase sigma factor [Candidatus Tectomicrobia bacterium]